MEEPESKICANCKREIPAVNYTIHTVHCARNIRVCPVCKEPVPQHELEDHHEKFHKLLPCKQCGESVCGTDLEDHIRDSCGHTIKSCRYCELELPRRELPAHENYCGVRTEQCPDCKEWVMIKYRQLHLDSNHGFLRLDDDPVPQPKKEPPKVNVVPRDVLASSSNANIRNNPNRARPIITWTNDTSANNPIPLPPRSYGTNVTGANRPIEFCNRPATAMRNATSANNPSCNRPATARTNVTSANSSIGVCNRPITTRTSNKSANSPIGICNRPITTRTNNTSANSPIEVSIPVSVTNGFHGQLNTSEVPKSAGVLSLISKVCASNGSGATALNQPKPSNTSGNHEPDLISWTNAMPSCSNASQKVKKVPLKRTNDQPQINTAVHTVDKIKKDLHGAVKKRVAPKPPPQAPPDERRDRLFHSALLRQQQEERRREELSAHNVSIGLPPVLSPAAKLEKLRKMDALQNREVDNQDYKNRLQGRVWMSPDVAGPMGHRLGSGSPENITELENRRNEFKDLKPMTTEEFMVRFRELELNVPNEEGARATGPRQEPAAANGNDRFSEIKSSLRELRRGLNEVTAPYNTNLNAASTNRVSLGNGDLRSSSRSPVPPPESEVRLPCEFCGTLVLPDNLVQHQTGCRPDLAQFRPRSASPGLARSSSPGLGRADPPSPQPPDVYDLPVIPCEFCTETLPVYLIIEHQEQCRNESDLLL